MKSFISLFVIFLLFVGSECQCPTGFTEDINTLCIDPSVCGVAGAQCNAAGSCCNPTAAAVTTAATTAAGVTVATTAGTGTGALGPCFDNECPTGYQCNTDLQLCYPTGCIGVCFDNTCPTGYTCNTATQLCCSSTNTTTSTTTCRDLIGPRGYSDCPARASLCNNTVYYDLMTQQCPRTCNRCTTSSVSSTVSTTCVDLTRANGTSDCPQIAYLCNNTIYYTLMTQQCPRTCGRCSSG